ncbi:bifunctional glutamate--cysteine ligase GshA/glutathione synthetase GshB [Alkalibacterium kapii]|uniref:Glutathione biosynthesis bifunctional protein GshAB n=1 Tax=Alkalibacterium kapii TaxID=426704 RepID=A0A511AWJ4_9LACT|nr:bifunctional glutamate--cysteine ligase GshA/glutathione synthetase GshB [Alkalibacterium kapii]GEK91481.1 glutathione biosynthesis bifunctional protein GshAB [Alkalibacterium kapii]
MNLKNIITNNHLEAHFKKGYFGIEKEGLRTDEKGNLAMTDHPKAFGSRSHHPYVQTDFSEAQLELVTPPQETLAHQYEWLKALHDVVNQTIAEDEFLWPFSMANILPEEAWIPIIKVNDQSEMRYREKLAEKYGKKKQMISGVHFNFSFTTELLDLINKHSDSDTTRSEWVNDIYLKMSRNFFRYQWILTYLFGASPVSHPSLLDSSGIGPVRSLRNSKYGYHNTFSKNVSYESIENYIRDIEELVEKEILYEEREYYGSSRLRGTGKNVRHLLNNGTRYVELRSFDLNPFNPMGFSYEQSLFVHAFLLTMVWMDEDNRDEDIKRGLEMNAETSLENPYSYSKFKEEGLSIIEKVRETSQELALNEEYTPAIDKATHLFHHPEETLSAKVMDKLKSNYSYIELGNELGKKHKQLSMEKPFLLSGFESMEMSTQLLMFDALQLGIKTEVLDANDQFLAFDYKGKKEYVRNGNMTSKDSYISHWIMANKTVTKKLLRKNNFSVPDGSEFSDLEEAENYYDIATEKAFVIKPKSTNYGVGITIFKQKPKKADYLEALNFAFKEDDSILIEEYIEGSEYRFFVLNGKVEAVLFREPANIVGDGKHSVEELINIKNQHPYRGEKHRAPLAKINIGELEAMMLKEQGYTFDSIIDKDKKVYLRENSNISTGGDPIDVTDDMHASYKVVAEEIARTLDVKVTGLDLIIPELFRPSSKNNKGYSVIEANFNPAMNMHAYVEKGKGRRLSMKVLEMLYPNVELS